MGRGRLADADLFRGCHRLVDGCRQGGVGYKNSQNFCGRPQWMGWSLGILCFYSNNLWRLSTMELGRSGISTCILFIFAMPLTQVWNISAAIKSTAKKALNFSQVCVVCTKQARAQSCSNTKFPYIQRTVAVYICSCIVHGSRKQKNQTVCTIMSSYRLYAGMMEAHFFVDHKYTADTKMLNPMWFLLFAHPELNFILVDVPN